MPWPGVGSLSFHIDPFGGVPPNHGGKAGLSVPIVSCPSWTRFSCPVEQSELFGAADFLELPPQPAAIVASRATAPKSKVGFSRTGARLTRASAVTVRDTVRCSIRQRRRRCVSIRPHPMTGLNCVCSHEGGGG